MVTAVDVQSKERSVDSADTSPGGFAGTAGERGSRPGSGKAKRHDPREEPLPRRPWRHTLPCLSTIEKLVAHRHVKPQVQVAVALDQVATLGTALTGPV